MLTARTGEPRTLATLSAWCPHRRAPRPHRAEGLDADGYRYFLHRLTDPGYRARVIATLLERL